ncbi:endolytic transglycosylase MltG [Candidatus Daviesbacteria bacterium]|nr:endolytic transglycosylase MltG [Candidatus Daviesbacteria bacterium]
MRYFLPIGILLVTLFLAVIVWWNNNLSPTGSSTTEKSIIIPKGESFGAVSQKLQNEGLIKSTLVFNLYARQQGLSDKLQPGTFKLSPSMGAREILQAITSQPLEIWVTLLEGWRKEEMADKLNQALGIDKGQFIKKAKEGYMFPDTYLFSKDITVDQIVETMENTFDQKLTDDIKNKFKSQGLTQEQGVVLASIVEREARSDEVRTKVAGILLKRFTIEMGLNADATVQYALGYQPKEKSWWKRHLAKADLQIDSPYNTYLHAGLPPAPISNPSLSSLKAVANADSSTPYLYYYHDSRGNSYYAKTLEEHNQNVANHP